MIVPRAMRYQPKGVKPMRPITASTAFTVAVLPLQQRCDVPGKLLAAHAD